MRDALPEDEAEAPVIRVIGLGSPFGDDTVGWRVIDLLQGLLPDAIDLVALDRPGAALINWMDGVDHLIVVDALCSGAEPGTLVQLSPADLDSESSRLTSHHLELPETFGLASSLGCLPARIDIYGVELGSCTLDNPSRAVKAAANELASLIAERIG